LFSRLVPKDVVKKTGNGFYMNSTSPPPFPIKSSEKSEIFFGKVKN
jgi:hypothetical protein